MHIALLTFQGFNELDSLVALGVLNHIKYLAAWIIARFHGEDAARGALHYVAPVGEKDEYVARGMKNIAPYLQ